MGERRSVPLAVRTSHLRAPRKKTTSSGSVVIAAVFNPQHSAEVSEKRRRFFGRREGKIDTIGNSKSLEGEGGRAAQARGRRKDPPPPGSAPACIPQVHFPLFYIILIHLCDPSTERKQSKTKRDRSSFILFRGER